MKYETPELAAPMPAINAIQSGPFILKTNLVTSIDCIFVMPGVNNEVFSTYADWE
jgi:hypothetical protein